MLKRFVRAFIPSVDMRTASGKEFFWTPRGRGRNKSPATLAIASTLTWPFEFQRESFFHRFAKAFGFATELQTGDTEFDAKFYICCDNQDVLRQFKLNATLRDLVKKLFLENVDSISNDPKDGRLIVTLKRNVHAIDEGTSELLVDLLRQYKQQCMNIHVSDPHRNSRLIAHTSIGVCMVASAATFIYLTGIHHRLSNVWEFIAYSIPIGIVIALAILIILRAVNGSSSYGALRFTGKFGQRLYRDECGQ